MECSLLRPFFGSLVRKCKTQPLRQEGHFPESLLQHIEIKLDILKDLPVREKCHLCAVLIAAAFSDNLQLVHRLASLISLLVDFSLVKNPDLQPLGEGVDDGCAHTVKTSGYFISSSAEFSSGMENGKHNLNGGDSRLMINSNGDSPAVIRHSHGIILMNRNLYMIAGTCKSLIDRIINNFINQMMQTSGRSGSDIHTGSFAYRFEAFQNLYLISAIFL